MHGSHQNFDSNQFLKSMREESAREEASAPASPLTVIKNVGVLIFLLVVGCIAAKVWWDGRALNARLWKDGVRVTATVATHQQRQVERRISKYRREMVVEHDVDVRFTTREGKPMTANLVAENKAALRVGDRLTVVYDPTESSAPHHTNSVYEIHYLQGEVGAP